MRKRTDTADEQTKEAASALYAEAASALQALLNAHSPVPGDSDVAGARSFLAGLIHQLNGRERERG